MPLDLESIPGPKNIVRKEYANGMTVLVKENFSSPSVVIDGLVRAGAADDAPDRAGLSAFTADMLMRGTQQRSFAEIYETIEAVGATVDVSSGVNVTSFGAKSLAEDCALVVDVLAESLQRPTFPDSEVEKDRGEILTSLQERANDTRRMAGLTFRELLYPAGHPYGRSTEGYVESITAITRDELAQYHQQAYGAHGLIVSIVGAIKADEAFKIWEDAFGNWIGARVERGPIPPAPALDRTARAARGYSAQDAERHRAGLRRPRSRAAQLSDGAPVQLDPGRVWIVWPAGRKCARKRRPGLLLLQPGRRRPGAGRVARDRGRRSGQRR